MGKVWQLESDCGFNKVNTKVDYNSKTLTKVTCFNLNQSIGVRIAAMLVLQLKVNNNAKEYKAA